MPLGFERLNERTKRPNEFINFIRPLPGPDEELSRDFLERVAAICHPIMKTNHVAVMALEEHEPNQEFIGRNFNNGEVIQLVLKAPFTGQWMPFKHVQMVMMHELAHCKQMNHSKAFWKVRDQYATELRGLWDRGYTGEGLWGRGKSLLSGRYETDVMPEAVQNIDRLCGGTFRSRGRKRRKANDKPKPTYAERKQKRIQKKFGKAGAGVVLGGDEELRAQLEGGKKVKGKPRVAGSARGRELRAAAVLARIDQTEKEQEEDVQLIEHETESETDYDVEETTGEAATDTDGKKMTDSKGRSLVNVCGSEDPNDDDAKREMRELFDYGFSRTRKRTPQGKGKGKAAVPANATEATEEKEEAITTASEDKEEHDTGLTLEPSTNGHVRAPERAKDGVRSTSVINEHTEWAWSADEQDPSGQATAALPSHICPVCSLHNDHGAVTCAACANVLDMSVVPNHWRCESASCSESAYVNSGDCGRCGLCGATKPKS